MNVAQFIFISRIHTPMWTLCNTDFAIVYSVEYFCIKQFNYDTIIVIVLCLETVYRDTHKLFDTLWEIYQETERQVQVMNYL